MSDYSKMTDDDFQDILTGLMQDDGVGSLLQIPGVYEAVSEHYNNDVLDVWSKRQAEKED